jgi:hypothetical protein
MMKKGDKVIRKNLRGQIGTIKAVLTPKARVRWSGALRPFAGGHGDNHSTLKISSLLPATETNLEKMKLAKEKRHLVWARRRYEECKNWFYCPQCHTRFINGYDCYRCGPIDPEQVESWLTHTKDGREISELLEAL